MTSPLRPGWVLLSVLILLLSATTGCDDDPPPPIPDAGQQPTDSGTDAGSEDAGTDAGPEAPWDGGYTVLDDPGDWIDRGAFSACRFTVENPSLEACADPANFDMSSCNADQLAAVEQHGIYVGDGRSERRLADGARPSRRAPPPSSSSRMGVPTRSWAFPSPRGRRPAAPSSSPADSRIPTPESASSRWRAVRRPGPTSSPAAMSVARRRPGPPPGAWAPSRPSGRSGAAKPSRPAGCGSSPSSHLRVLDVTDPANIVKIGEHRMRYSTSIHNMILKGERLYVAWYHEGVRVLDVANPTQPRQVAHFNTFRETDPHRADGAFEGAIGIRVPGDGYVYVVDTSRGLLIFNEP
ncbi:putative lipoprotein [Myxococcus xanthus DK 1622]|uniref:Lipoprotein n=1 Tax=Myxococcus xanthus (strain DK1622) TaxID=246197 RepID=Q1CVV5_MYXXD|nr:putative lipoprotein [Myxococcus xanthus DK 1622]